MAEDKTNQPASEAADEQATSATNAQSAEVTDQTSSEATDSASESATSTQTDLASALAQVADLKKQLEQASDQNLRAQARFKIFRRATRKIKRL